jgi:hypothetical protein
MAGILAEGAGPKTYICHTCDNPACVNPKHLFAGTPRDNVKDMIGKRRHQHGETAHNARLTEQQALEVLRSSGSQRAIAAKYGICQSHVSLIKSGKHWGHLQR